MTERELLEKAHWALNSMFRFQPKYFPADATPENCPSLKTITEAWAVLGEVGDYLYTKRSAVIGGTSE